MMSANFTAPDMAKALHVSESTVRRRLRWVVCVNCQPIGYNLIQFIKLINTFYSMTVSEGPSREVSIEDWI